MNLIKEKYPELLHGMSTDIEINEVYAIEISDDGNTFNFAYPCDMYGSIISSTVKIRRDEQAQGDLEVFIDYLIKKIAISENKIFNQEEKAVLRAELHEFIMNEAEEHVNRHSIPDYDDDEEDDELTEEKKS